MSQYIGPTISMKIPQPLLDRLDALAASFGTSRSDVMRNCLEVGVSMGEDYHRCGLRKIENFLSRAKQAMKSCGLQMSLF